jgi:hypothetical protein
LGVPIRERAVLAPQEGGRRVTGIRVVGRSRLDFGAGSLVRVPGAVTAVEEVGEVVAVLLAWIDEAVDRAHRRIHGNNLYGYSRGGRRLWRVHGPTGVKRPLLLTGMLDGEVGLRLHEAHGWWVDVDPPTGRVTRVEWIG